MFGRTKENEKARGDQELSSEKLKQAFTDCPDIVFSDISVKGNKRLRLTLVYVEGLVDERMTDDFILKPLVQEEVFAQARSQQAVIDLIVHGAVYHNQRTLREKLDDCVDDILSGSVALIFDETRLAVTFELKGFEKRSITEPTNENVLKGSKESFVEVLRVNTALVRRRLQTKDLKFIRLVLGSRSKTVVIIVYLDGVANGNTVAEVRRRLCNIKIDGIISAGQIEAFLLDKPKSLFPQVLYTERADKFCGNLLEGRVGIMIDGMPLAYIVPVDLNSFLQAPEDYALHYLSSSIFRVLRYISAFVALTLPSIYVSMTTFHHEMLPTDLVSSIVASKQGVPFPTFVEVLLMLFAFELLLEAGLRLPQAIGQTVSIVGAVVVGQAAITAKLLSPGVVIVIAAAGISGFVIPSQDLANIIRICRFFLVLFSVASGLFGVIVGLIALLYHLCTLEVFDTPYLSPFVACEGRGLFSDTITRGAWYNLKKRPANVAPGDDTRQGS